MALVVTLVSLLYGTIGRFRQLSHRTHCMNNLRNIYVAMVNYYAEHEQLPNMGLDADDNACDLRQDLRSYGTVSKTFDCPDDRNNTQPNSYQPFYIQLQTPVEGHSYAISCPRHDGEVNTVVQFADSSIIVHPSGTAVDQQGDPIKLGDEVDKSKVQFWEGSNAQVNQQLKLRVVATFKIADQIGYSVISVNTDELGMFKCDVTKGSQFDVATPSAVIGVHGTKFDIKTQNAAAPQTSVRIIEGEVEVQGLPKNGNAVLRPGPTGNRCRATRGQGIEMDVF
jgi:hypothetical protein